MELVFSVETTLGLLYVVLQENSDTPKIKVLCFGNLSQTLHLGGFSFLPRNVDRRKCCSLNSKDHRRQFITLSVHFCLKTISVMQRVTRVMKFLAYHLNRTRMYIRLTETDPMRL